MSEWTDEFEGKSILLTGSNGIRTSLFEIKATDMRLKAEPEIESDNLFFLWKKKCSSPSTERSHEKESFYRLRLHLPISMEWTFLYFFRNRDKGLCHRQKIRQSFLGYRRQEHSFIYGWCVKRGKNRKYNSFWRIYMFEQNSRNDTKRIHFMKNERQTTLPSKFQVNERSL